MADHRCPVWAGYLLASSVRKLRQSPEKILDGLVAPGMTVLDLGCAMGFFSFPMARMVGVEGRVICVDVQQKMLDVLGKRAKRCGLSRRLVLHKCQDDTLGLNEYLGQVDFALLFAVMHEVSDPTACFQELHDVMKTGGRLLFAEPTGHVDPRAFQLSLDLATTAGFSVMERPVISRSHAALLEKAGNGSFATNQKKRPAHGGPSVFI